MLIRVLEGTYQNDALEPNGREIWAAEVEDLTAAALHATGIQVDPGTWYELDQFKRLVNATQAAGDVGVFSTVSTKQSGVGRSWTATIEVAESTAALMVCRSVIEHVERLKKETSFWVRVE